MTEATMGATGSIVVLHEALNAGARPDETDGLVQVDQVSAALRSLGWPVSVLATGLDLEATHEALARSGPACVFNLVESLAGNGRLITLVPQLLAAMGIAFTGCAGGAIHLSSDKILAKRWMRRCGIPVPNLLGDGGRPDESSRWIVKSVWEHASLGLDADSVVVGAATARARIEQCRARYGGDWFAEAYVEGREFNISLLERDRRPAVLPIAEMNFVDFPADQPRIVGYAAKWDPAATEYHATRRAFGALAAAERDALSALAVDCWHAFGLQGYARVDVRLDAAGLPWVLEVNANPCLSRDAGFAAAALEAGIDYPQLIGAIVDAAVPGRLAGVRRVG